jgi:hypothetical protein
LVTRHTVDDREECQRVRSVGRTPRSRASKSMGSRPLDRRVISWPVRRGGGRGHTRQILKWRRGSSSARPRDRVHQGCGSRHHDLAASSSNRGLRWLPRRLRTTLATLVMGRRRPSDESREVTIRRSSNWSSSSPSHLMSRVSRQKLRQESNRARSSPASRRARFSGAETLALMQG